MKSDLDERKTVQGAVANLLSVSPLDLTFRHRSDEYSLPPITKFLFGLRRTAQDSSVSQWIAESYRDALAKDATLARPIVEALSTYPQPIAGSYVAGRARLPEARGRRGQSRIQSAAGLGTSR